MSDGPPYGWNRDRLVELMARGIRRQLTYLDDAEARAVADTQLREMKAVGLRIKRPQPPHRGSGRSQGRR